MASFRPLIIFNIILCVIVFTGLGAHAGVIVNTTITQELDPAGADHNIECSTPTHELFDTYCMLNAALTMMILVAALYILCFMTKAILAGLRRPMSTSVPLGYNDRRRQAAAIEHAIREVATASRRPRAIREVGAQEVIPGTASINLPIRTHTAITSTQVRASHPRELLIYHT